jgi:hypothetical protein
VRLALFTLLLGACSYSSRYAPPADGRARVVWTGSDVALDVSRPDAPPGCAEQLKLMSGTMQLHLSPSSVLPATAASEPVGPVRMVGPSGGFWVPRYYGPRLIVVGGAPPILHPVVFSPSLTLARAFASSFASSGSVHVPAPSSGGFRLGGGSGGSGDAGKVLVYVAVIMLLILPALDLGLALYRPETERLAAQVTDQVNAYNDLARTFGTFCSYGALP